MTIETTPPHGPTASGDPLLNDALQARLAALASKRTPAPARPNGPATSGSTPPPVPPTARTSTRRRHPARHSRTAALALSFVSTGGLGYLLAATDPGVSAAPPAPAGVVTPAATEPTATAASTAPATNPQDTAPTVATQPETPAPTSTDPIAAPIVVNGETFTNRWGPVQVQATFAVDGTLTSVDALQTPFSDGKSVRINDDAVPRLNAEALTAQHANVDTVSGATYTSDGYNRSLQSAIDIALANGVAAGQGAA